MTQIILHRINTINLLKKSPKKFGVEVDVRSYNGSLILHHEPFKKGPDFSKWLKFYSHTYLIINIKEEGLEIPILKLLQKFKLKNFFFLDQSFPFLVKFSKKIMIYTKRTYILTYTYVRIYVRIDFVSAHARAGRALTKSMRSR